MFKSFIKKASIIAMSLIISSSALAMDKKPVPTMEHNDGNTIERNNPNKGSLALTTGGGFMAGSALTYFLSKKGHVDPIVVKNVFGTFAHTVCGGFLKGSAFAFGFGTTGYGLYQWKGAEMIEKINHDVQLNVRNNTKNASETFFDVAKERTNAPVSWFIKKNDK